MIVEIFFKNLVKRLKETVSYDIEQKDGILNQKSKQIRRPAQEVQHPIRV